MPAAADYLQRLRRRLLLDWDDPIFQGPLFVGEGGAARKKLTEIVSPRSEDAVIWNVFRTLGRLPSESWLLPVLRLASCSVESISAPLSIAFWRQVSPPQRRLRWLLDHLDTLAFHDPRQAGQARQRLERVRGRLDSWQAAVTQGSERGDGIFEGGPELDVVLTCPDLLVVVEARSNLDVPTRTPWDPQRDQIARCLDAALDLAGLERQPCFLLVTDDYLHAGVEALSMAYEKLLPSYRDDPAFRAARLSHRAAKELARLEGRIGWLSWADLVDTVLDHSAAFTLEQKRLLRDLVDYLRGRKLLHKGG